MEKQSEVPQKQPFEPLPGLHRSLSVLSQLNLTVSENASRNLRRENSHNELRGTKHGFMIDVEAARTALLRTEDTDGDDHITADDVGPKNLALGTVQSNGFRKSAVLGTYQLANLLQSLTVAQESKVNYIVVPDDVLTENPVDRLSRMIKETFWPSLTRRLDENMIEKATKDDKDWTDDPRPRIYVPLAETEQLQYYTSIAERRPELRLDVQTVPKEITAEVYLEMQKRPGLLALAMDKHAPGVSSESSPTLEGVPFIVPGGRFNELYGWDSFFTTLGLLSDGYLDLAKGIVRNFVFEIQHYGLIPNANRSYYLLRSQPPFLTDLALRVYEASKLEPSAKDFLRRAILAAIKEYKQVWTTEPRLDRRTGLSRYRPKGFGIPKETESTHFDKVLAPYADRRKMSMAEFHKAYDEGTIQEPELDTYFLHDRAVRESGHDVSIRLESVCADMATVDLNCCLYKYEKDIANAIRLHFGDHLVVPGEFCAAGEIPDHVETSAEWLRRARKRRMRMDHYLWNEEKGTYFDYNTAKHQQSTYETATSFWTMWCGVASPQQASALVSKTLPKFECPGGLSVGTEDFRGRTTCHDTHQWDFPYAWAPHQILAWDGMRNYGYHREAARLAYRWLHIITKMYVDYGAVVEKYDVMNIVDGHKVFAEYGNQGLVFHGFAREGFGWTNASYVYGLEMMSSFQRRALGVCAPYELYAKAEEIIESRDRAELLRDGDSAPSNLADDK